MGRDASTALVLIIRRRLLPILRNIILTIYYPFLYMCYYKRDIFICRVIQTIYINNISIILRNTAVIMVHGQLSFIYF